MACLLRLIGTMLFGIVLISCGQGTAKKNDQGTAKEACTGPYKDKTISQKDLKKVLNAHATWLETEEKKGKQANLCEADLRKADLTDADLRKADLRKADLTDADLTDAVLVDAILSMAKLMNANLQGADLQGADRDADGGLYQRGDGHSHSPDRTGCDR